MRHLFKSCDEVKFDFGDAHRCFDVIRALNFVDRFREFYEKDPGLARAQRARQLRNWHAHDAGGRRRGRTAEQTRIFRRFQQTFRDYDLVLSPAVPVSPFPWTQPYLAQMNGKALLNYYHWLSLTYVITLATNPAIALPCGLDHAGMPFGLQVIGRFRGDRELLGAAHALEQAFNAIPALQAAAARHRQNSGRRAGVKIDRDARALVRRRAHGR